MAYGRRRRSYARRRGYRPRRVMRGRRARAMRIGYRMY